MKPIPVPILLYHSVSRQVASRFSKWAVTPETFTAHLAYLREQGYTSITVTHLARAIANGKMDLPERPIVISFDDGLADFYSDALSILNDYDSVATLYIVTKYVGLTSDWLAHQGERYRPMLTWSQIAQICATGIECGAHGYSHQPLDTLPLAQAREEIVRSKTELEQRLGCPVETFAYPHGYYNTTIRQWVAEAGYSSACAVKHALSNTCDDRFTLARIVVSHDTTPEQLGKLLAGQGLRVASTKETVQTKSWRLVRKAVRLFVRPTY